jgi:hypothetical protein
VSFDPVFKTHNKKENVKTENAENHHPAKFVAIDAEFKQAVKYQQPRERTSNQQLAGNIVVYCLETDGFGTVA